MRDYHITVEGKSFCELGWDYEDLRDKLMTLYTKHHAICSPRSLEAMKEQVEAMKQAGYKDVVIVPKACEAY